MAHPRSRSSKSPRREKEGIVAAIETGDIGKIRIGVPTAVQIIAAITSDPTQGSGYHRATTVIILKSGTLRMKIRTTREHMREEHLGKRGCRI
jgi:hypothetical protein